MRHFLAALAVMALLCGSAFAVTLPGITVDGDYSDWAALGLVHEDSVGDNPGEQGSSYLGAVDISHYGATIIDGTLYAFTKLTEPLTAYESGVTRGFDSGPAMGIYINADQRYDTSLIGGEDAGIDLVVEVHDTLDTSIGVEYYGAGDSIGSDILAYYNHGTAAIIPGAYVVEWSVPVSDIRLALGGLPDGVDDSFDWTVYFGGEGMIINSNGSTSLSWGRDYAGPVSVVPEPGTFALLAAAGLALAMFGVRRLRRN